MTIKNIFVLYEVDLGRLASQGFNLLYVLMLSCIEIVQKCQ